MQNRTNVCPQAISLLLLLALTLSAQSGASGRGGFGGGGFRGGGGSFEGGRSAGDIGRSGGDGSGRDFDSSRSGFDRAFDGGFNQDRDAFNGGGDRASYFDSHPDDNGIRNFGNSNARSMGMDNLATDGGFGKVMGDTGLRGSSPWTNHTTRITPADLGSHANQVRNDFNHYDYFNRNWWQQHPGAWNNLYWRDYSPWGWTDWPALGGWWGVDTSDEPVYYDYGDNITYQGDSVFYGSQSVCSAADYYQQAQGLAASAPPVTPTVTSTKQKSASSGEWKPLGVFSLVQNNQNDSSQMVQLCVNKAGTIAGNYYNALTDDTKQISGAVDKKSMRACWMIGGNKNVIYDTGVGNLLKDQSPILVHYGKESTEQWLLVRLHNPSASNS